jgi:hypothetical protein
MTVGVDRSAVETALCGGGLGCPVAGCGGRLAPWGWARARGVRGEVGRVRLRPRRSVCVGCRRTQVLLPASVLPGGRTGRQGRVHRARSPTNQPYGYREYSARDPEGGLWSFMKPLD